MSVLKTELNARTIDAFQKQYEVPNASAGCNYALTNRIRIRINIASGYRAPNLAELASNGVHEGSKKENADTRPFVPGQGIAGIAVAVPVQVGV